MQSKNFVPRRDEALALWAGNLSALVSAGAGSYELLPADAMALAALTSAFDSTLSAAKNPGTRTPVAVAAKNTARVNLVALVRSLARRIQATASVTAVQKISLGLTVPEAKRTPIGPPVTRPVLSVAGRSGPLVTIRLADEQTPTRRAKPPGVDAASVYAFIGPAGTVPPAELSAWMYKGQSRRADMTLAFDPAAAGQIAHVRAVWINPRGVAGPLSDAVTAAVAA